MGVDDTCVGQEEAARGVASSQHRSEPLELTALDDDVGHAAGLGERDEVVEQRRVGCDEEHACATVHDGAHRTPSAKAQEASHEILQGIRAKAAQSPSKRKQPKSKSARVRDREGRFAGLRFNVESVPPLPTFPACWVLDDPRRRPYLVFWTHGDGAYALKMMPNDDGTAVLVTLDSGETYQINVLRRSLPSRRRPQGRVPMTCGMTPSRRAQIAFPS